MKISLNFHRKYFHEEINGFKVYNLLQYQINYYMHLNTFADTTYQIFIFGLRINRKFMS